MNPDPLRSPLAVHACPKELFQVIAQETQLQLRVITRGVRLATQIRPDGLVLHDDTRIHLPAAGLLLDPRRICSVHSRRSGIEIDFTPTDHRLDFIPGDKRLAVIETLYGSEEIGEDQLRRMRAACSPCFIPCDCCRTAASQRRMNASEHPLAIILASSHELQITIRTLSYTFSQAHDSARVRTAKGWIITQSREDAVLKIDAGYLHAMSIGKQKLDGEWRPTLRAYDMLGREVLEISSPYLDDALRWQMICETSP